MIDTCIYFAFLLFIAILVFWKGNILGKIIWGYYCFIGFFSVLSVKLDLVDSVGVSIFPYLFLILTYLVYFWPLMRKDRGFDIAKLEYDVNEKYAIFAVIYCIFALIAIYVMFPTVMQLLSSGNWMENRQALYNGDLVFRYSNVIEYWSLLFIDYLRLLALILGFIMIYNEQYKKLAITMIILAILTRAMNAIYISSRGEFLDLALLVFSIYFVFAGRFEKNMRRLITVIIIIAVIAVIPYIIDVTVSRFGNMNASGSIISYLGQAPIVFNRGVSPVHKYQFGNYSFGMLWGIDNIPQSEIGGNWGTSFYTFVGSLYIDFGPVGTLLVGMVISFFAWYECQKPFLTISDVFIILFYFSTLMQGGLVLGRSYCYTIIASLLIYAFIKIFFEKIRITVNGR
jgi:oligosaccharide repeat unit polymerase